MQDIHSILTLVAQEGGAALARERKTSRESTQKARAVTSGRQAAVLPSMRRKGLGFTGLCKGAPGLRFAWEHAYSISQPGTWKDPRKPPVLQCQLWRALACPVHVHLQFPGCQTGQSDICLWEGDLVPVH